MKDHSLSPVPDENWRNPAPDTTALLTERLFDFQVMPRRRNITGIRLAPLPYYPDHVLCDIRTEFPGEPVEWICCLYGRDGFRKLDGNSGVIHDLNAEVSPDLSDTDVQHAYLKFFCFFVHGDEGPFEIISSADDLKGDVDLPVNPPALDTETGLWTANVLYGTTFFEAQFKIEGDGHIRMESDTPIRQGVSRNPSLIFDGAVRRLRDED